MTNNNDKTAQFQRPLDTRVHLRPKRQRPPSRRWGVSHSELLLRSNKDETNHTRVEILFGPVEAIKMRAVMSGLRIVELAGDEAKGIERDAALGDPDAVRLLTGPSIFALESSAFRGYVIASAIFVREDDLGYRLHRHVYRLTAGAGGRRVRDPRLNPTRLRTN